MTDTQEPGRGTDGQAPLETTRRSTKAPWQMPRIVDYGSLRNLVRNITGNTNEGVGVGTGVKSFGMV